MDINKKILSEKEINFLENYLNAESPVGFEMEGQKIWLDYIKNYVDKTFIDNYGTCVGVINPDNEFKVVIEGHADEISWFVNYITDEGLLHVIRNGGVDHIIAPAKRVNIHTEKNGKIKGIFGWPAIHTRGEGRGKSKEEIPSVNNLTVDVGVRTKKEVSDLGIQIGDVITYNDKFIQIQNNFVCRALDNRIGGFMIAQVAKLLFENKDRLPFGLYVVNSVQEEIGLRGAQMITQSIKPNIAIVTDVTHDTSTPMIDKKIEGDTKCGEGPVIFRAPSIQNNLRQLILNTARKYNIPYQLNASSSSTGTDTDSFAYSNGGVISALISLPLRYMHTTVEMVNKNDVENLIKLMYLSIKDINPSNDFKYIKL